MKRTTTESEKRISAKYFMHTPANISSFFLIPVLLIVCGFFIAKDAYNGTMRIVGIIGLAAIFALALWIFLIKFRIFDWLIFTEEGVERHSPIGRTLTYIYSELYAVIGMYTSVAQEKPCLIFTPKSLGIVANHIDTSKRGNIVPANKNGVIFCKADAPLVEYLKSINSLEWAK